VTRELGRYPPASGQTLSGRNVVAARGGVWCYNGEARSPLMRKLFQMAHAQSKPLDRTRSMALGDASFAGFRSEAANDDFFPLRRFGFSVSSFGGSIA